jgi:tetratricopeptide (TPR) repeat protein
MGLFKSGDELIELGYSSLRQGDFSKALNNFEKAKEKLSRQQGSSQDIQTAEVMTKLLRVNFNFDNPVVYTDAADALKSLGDQEILFGVRNVKASEICNECMIKSQELKALSIPTSSKTNYEQRAKELQEVGIKYQTTIGNNILLIPEIFKKAELTASSRGLMLFAESQENKGEAIVWSDPKKAAEYYQNAANYRKQAGDLNRESQNLAIVKQYSKAVRCWFCDRQIAGEQIHFFSMPSEITELQRVHKNQSPLPSKHDAGDHIYACRACHQAISKKADEIAVHYHNIAIDFTKQVQSDLQHQINEIIKAINRIH